MKRVLLTLAASFGILSLEAWEVAPFDNGLNDFETIEEKAKVLKQLGYNGTTWRPSNTAEVLPVLDKKDLKLYATYVVLRATETECPIPEETIQEIEVLKGRDTYVWLTIIGETSDQIAIEAISKIADISAANDLKVALYPHYGFKLDTVSTCLRLAKAAGKENVGLTFNLCHFLKQNNENNLANTIQSIGDKLWLVSVNGADSGDTRSMGWDQLIQPLGEGTFKVENVLRELKNVGYEGPILLQCYNIPQPDLLHLETSKKNWTTLDLKSLN